eukprot:ANDGO_00672.mRNA.1 hypothetical protein
MRRYKFDVDAAWRGFYLACFLYCCLYIPVVWSVGKYLFYQGGKEEVKELCTKLRALYFNRMVRWSRLPADSGTWTIFLHFLKNYVLFKTEEIRMLLSSFTMYTIPVYVWARLHSVRRLLYWYSAYISMFLIPVFRKFYVIIQSVEDEWVKPELLAQKASNALTAGVSYGWAHRERFLLSACHISGSIALHVQKRIQNGMWSARDVETDCILVKDCVISVASSLWEHGQRERQAVYRMCAPVSAWITTRVERWPEYADNCGLATYQLMVHAAGRLPWKEAVSSLSALWNDLYPMPLVKPVADAVFENSLLIRDIVKAVSAVLSNRKQAKSASREPIDGRRIDTSAPPEQAASELRVSSTSALEQDKTVSKQEPECSSHHDEDAKNSLRVENVTENTLQQHIEGTNGGENGKTAEN